VPNDVGGYDILAGTVVEVSLTPVPANEGAVALVKDLFARQRNAPTKDDVALQLGERGRAALRWRGDEVGR
jgi:hypothetical protein